MVSWWRQGHRTPAAKPPPVCQSSLSRRQLLRYAALVGATFPTVAAFEMENVSVNETSLPLSTVDEVGAKAAESPGSQVACGVTVAGRL